MSTVTRFNQGGSPPSGPGLPLRWAIIAILASTAGVVGFVAAGVVAAITVACVVATAAHRLLA